MIKENKELQIYEKFLYEALQKNLNYDNTIPKDIQIKKMIERFNYLISRQKELKEDMVLIEENNKHKTFSKKENFDKFSNEIISLNSQINKYVRSIERKKNQVKNLNFKIKNNLKTFNSYLKRKKAGEDQIDYVHQ